MINTWNDKAKLMTAGKSVFFSKQLFGLKLGELLLLVALYAAFGIFYYSTLAYTGAGSDIWKQMPIYYSMTIIFVAPVWWLMFRRLRHLTIENKIFLHLLILPIFVLTWRASFYLICDFFGLGHLGGRGSAWDIYIPSLFYFTQFGFFHVYDYYQKLQKQQALESSLRELALKNELSALKAQLNPHFLYNIFNTISASVPPAQEQTRVLIAKLSDLFRYHLKASQKDLVSIREELDFIQKYLDLEKERLGERLDILLVVPPDVKEELIPPLILQPLVENAIKHGIAPKIEGGRVEIHINKAADELFFEVKDTGKGSLTMEDAELLERGYGLTNTNKRLKHRYGRELQFSANHPEGFIVSFTIPAKNRDQMIQSAVSFVGS